LQCPKKREPDGLNLVRKAVTNEGCFANDGDSDCHYVSGLRATNSPEVPDALLHTRKLARTWTVLERVFRCC
jgi:hypothetical protein